MTDITNEKQASNNLPFGTRRAWLIVSGIFTVVVVGGLMVLLNSGRLPVGKLQNIQYSTGQAGNYTLQFYGDHTEKRSDGAAVKLVSRVSKAGKFPVTLSITEGSQSDYDHLKDCAMYRKAMSVQNDNLKQNIALCAAPDTGGIPEVVYTGGFLYRSKVGIVTVGQDLQLTDDQGQGSAQSAMDKLGLASYKSDIQTIIASIRAE
jgi:hypothetical protein